MIAALRDWWKRRQQLYVVVWFPSPAEAPHLIGPFRNHLDGLATRDAVRAQQRRQVRMAQLVPMARAQKMKR